MEVEEDNEYLMYRIRGDAILDDIEESVFTQSMILKCLDEDSGRKTFVKQLLGVDTIPKDILDECLLSWVETSGYDNFVGKHIVLAEHPLFYQ